MKDLSINNRDLEWAQQIRAGSQSAFTDLFETYYGPLCEHAFRLVSDRDLMEDVVQDVFRWIWEQRKCWKPSISVRAYLCRAVHNRVITNLRKKRFEFLMGECEEHLNEYSQYIIMELSQNDESHNKELAKALRDALNILPERRREILLLYLLQGYTYKEISEMLDISVNTVNTQIHRARKTLCDRLKPYFLN